VSTKVLIVYASVSGSTGEVAEAIGEVIEQAGAVVDVSPINEVASLEDYGAVVLGSSIRAGRWLPEATRFLEKNHEDLSRVPVAYFTTCLTMVDDTAESRRTVLTYMEPILQSAPDIEPVGLGLFAGSLDPNRSLMMQSIGPQGDYRNWEAIRSWAEEIGPVLFKGQVRPVQPIILREAILRFTDMSGADLYGADLRESDLSESDLSGADLGETDLIKADLHKAELNEASLQRAGLNWADLNWANMSEADLRQANLIGADLNKANLRQANLSGAVLNGANLSGADLSETNLSGADLNWAVLNGADLSRANVTGASLGWADFTNANLSGANLEHARYNGQTKWPEGFAADAQGCVFFSIE
jgi:uncharacterized protein YjbI with pentapeptide repeats/menaquinone-dependent protoporphyrinogen IX oxidase